MIYSNQLGSSAIVILSIFLLFCSMSECFTIEIDGPNIKINKNDKIIDIDLNYPIVFLIMLLCVLTMSICVFLIFSLLMEFVVAIVMPILLIFVPILLTLHFIGLLETDIIH